MTTVDRLQRIQELRSSIEESDEAEFQEEMRRHQSQVERIKIAKGLGKRNIASTLDFLAIGDSWFRYPLENNVITPFNFAIAAQLESMGNPSPNIFNLAWPGRASTSVLSYKNQDRIIRLLNDPDQWVNGKPDAILVSMGGDDLVGDQFAIYLEYGGTGGLSQRFKGVLDLVSASYQDLFDLRKQFAPGVPIFSHCYDYPLPSGVPAALILGPWIWPSFKFALYDYTSADMIAKKMVDEFYTTLTKLVPGNNFFVVDTRTTLKHHKNYPDGWSNEMHPYTPGFVLLADVFLKEIRKHFPPGSI